MLFKNNIIYVDVYNTNMEYRIRMNVCIYIFLIRNSICAWDWDGCTFNNICLYNQFKFRMDCD